MRSLNPPELDAEGIYSRIANARNEPARARLLESADKVLEAYGRYEDAAGLCALLDRADVLPAIPADLTSSYIYLGKARPEWRGAILANNKGGTCPLCTVGRVSTLDHYLPQGSFPEFAILPLNLVPACSVCQSNKRQLYREADEPMFLHLYFDDLPLDERYLFADVDVVETGISLDYWVEPPRSMPPGVAQRQPSGLSRRWPDSVRYERSSKPPRTCAFVKLRSLSHQTTQIYAHYAPSEQEVQLVDTAFAPRPAAPAEKTVGQA